MTKYGFVLLTGRCDEFLARLQELGVVDVTAAEWEPAAEQRELLAGVERVGTAVDYGRGDSNVDGATAYPTGEEASDAYWLARTDIARLDGELAALEKARDEATLWGSFSRRDVEELSLAGVSIRLGSMYSTDFKRLAYSGAEDIPFIELIFESGGQSYFAVVGELPEGAQEHRLPEYNLAEIEVRIGDNRQLAKEQEQILKRVAASAEVLKKYRSELLDRLSFSKAQGSATTGAEGLLTVIEGYAPAEHSAGLEALISEFEDVYVMSSPPEDEDDVPVALKTSHFMDAFRFVGDFYALPKYGTIDLVPFFAPFYMLFFGFCMGDAGYGAILTAGYFVLRKKASMLRVARLTLYCGLASVVFGLLTGSAFGISVADWAPLAGLKELFLDTDTLFYLALGLGLLQILFGTLINIIGISRQQGFMWSLGRVGWFIVVISSLTAFLMHSISSTWYLVALCTGLTGMLVLNNPRRNPLINIGAGLWNTYNDVTGLLGDGLSYIRLFALCLSGGTLAVVFNSLVVGITGSIPLIIGIPIAILLLLFLHAINIFMAVIGSFVHPMRLTFVEFYKNAGFEPASRAYEPLKRS